MACFTILSRGGGNCFKVMTRQGEGCFKVMSKTGETNGKDDYYNDLYPDDPDETAPPSEIIVEGMTIRGILMQNGRLFGTVSMQIDTVFYRQVLVEFNYDVAGGGIGRIHGYKNAIPFEGVPQLTYQLTGRGNIIAVSRHREAGLLYYSFVGVSSPITYIRTTLDRYRCMNPLVTSTKAGMNVWRTSKIYEKTYPESVEKYDGGVCTLYPNCEDENINCTLFGYSSDRLRMSQPSGWNIFDESSSYYDEFPSLNFVEEITTYSDTGLVPEELNACTIEGNYGKTIGHLSVYLTVNMGIMSDNHIVFWEDFELKDVDYRIMTNNDGTYTATAYNHDVVEVSEYISVDLSEFIDVPFSPSFNETFIVASQESRNKAILTYGDSYLYIDKLDETAVEINNITDFTLSGDYLLTVDGTNKISQTI